MSDLISREDVLIALLNKGQRSRRYKCGEKWELDYDEIREAIGALPSAEAYTEQHVRDAYNSGYSCGMEQTKEALSADAEWIPCSERLPEEGELVLVTVWNDVDIAWRNIYGGWESAENMYEKVDVTAWMPLPKPYKESEVEECG